MSNRTGGRKRRSDEVWSAALEWFLDDDDEDGALCWTSRGKPIRTLAHGLKLIRMLEAQGELAEAQELRDGLMAYPGRERRSRAA